MIFLAGLFKRSVVAGKRPVVQLSVDATRMFQAFTGSGYIRQMVSQEAEAFVQRYRKVNVPPVDLAPEPRFNPAPDRAIEHLLVMPVLIQDVVLVAPTTHFVQLGQAILFRGGGS